MAPSNASPQEDFLDLACLVYDKEDHPSRRDRAREILASYPGLSGQSPAVAAALGRLDDLRAQLQVDPSAATRRFPPRDWEPLLYLAYSRVSDPSSDYLGAAALLLDMGADPNAHFYWGGQYRFTALTGVLGDGEQGPVNQPEHPAGLPLARLLLARGADPNDSQALYNCMFRPGAECLAMLLDAGLGPEAQLNWLDESGRRVEGSTLGYQLMWDVEHGHAERVRALLAAGVEPGGAELAGRRPWFVARVNGHLEIARMLEDAGAPRESLDEVDEFTSSILAGNLREVKQLLGRGSDLVERALQRRPNLLVLAASRADLSGLRALLALGVDPNRGLRAPPLHEALGEGRVDAARILVAAGADPTLRDREFGGDALGWARHGGHEQAVSFIERVLEQR